MLSQSSADIAVIGLGVMGLNLALNFADSGFKVAAFDPFPEVVEKVRGGLEPKVGVTGALEELIGSLKKPAKILIMVKAGGPIDGVINSLIPLLAPGDIIMDGGNTLYQDTVRRQDTLAEHGIHFVGLGVSGGQEGARHGPALMAGGAPEAVEAVAPLLSAIAARAHDGTPCYAAHGPGGAGHFVKMVHNGIEYALMQMLAEAYLLMSDPGNMSASEISAAFEDWNKGPAASYLIEISATVMATKDLATGKPLVELIRDRAGHKGTGRWTVEAGFDYGIALPAVAAAFLARALSARDRLPDTRAKLDYTPDMVTNIAGMIGEAFPAVMLAAYAQGFDLIQAASDEQHWDTDLRAVAKGWRAGCIIRAAMLDPISSSLDNGDILASEFAAKTLAASERPLRQIVQFATAAGVPVPALYSALAWLDARRCPVLGANLIQGQRDLFGAHTFERIDQAGVFHHDWDDQA